MHVQGLVLTGWCLPFSGETVPVIILSGITLEVSGCLSWSLGQELVSLTPYQWRRVQGCRGVVLGHFCFIPSARPLSNPVFQLPVFSVWGLICYHRRYFWTSGCVFSVEQSVGDFSGDLSLTYRVLVKDSACVGRRRLSVIFHFPCVCVSRRVPACWHHFALIGQEDRWCHVHSDLFLGLVSALWLIAPCWDLHIPEGWVQAQEQIVQTDHKVPC